MRGYIVHKKNIHYYKCNTIGCNNNKNAKSLNQTFAKIMDAFRIDKATEFIHLIKQQTIATFNQLTKGHEDEYQLLQNQLKELNQKINRIEVRFIEEKIKVDLYNRFYEKYAIEMKELESILLKAPK